MRRFTTGLLLLVLSALLWLKLTPAGLTQTPASNASEANSLEIHRLWIASKIYASVEKYFAHWQAIPNVDLDAQYKEYLQQVLASGDRRVFDLASMKFIANLGNGHTRFHDDWMDRHYGQPLSFKLNSINNQWVVVEAQIKALRPGDVVQAINGMPFNQFYAAKRSYLFGSNEDSRKIKLIETPSLWPDRFTLTLSSGKTVPIVRHTQQISPSSQKAIEGRMLNGNIAYLKIPGFVNPNLQQEAVEFVVRHLHSPALIVDVRGNRGGSTPTELIATLMDRPWQQQAESSPLSIPMLDAYRQELNSISLEEIDDFTRGSLAGLASLSNAQLMSFGEWQMPQSSHYKGKVFIISDGGCASACEDFLIPFKANKRVQIIGTTSRGTTGGPYFFEFGNGMSLSVGSKRTYFPDGKPFEGVGVQPDIEIQPSINDIRNHTDVMLNKALELAREDA